MGKRNNIEITAFGKKLKQLRVKKGITQLDLEIESGIPRTDISRIENGLINISFSTIVKLAEALEINLGDFFSE